MRRRAGGWTAGVSESLSSEQLVPAVHQPDVPPDLIDSGDFSDMKRSTESEQFTVTTTRGGLQFRSGSTGSKNSHFKHDEHLKPSINRQVAKSSSLFARFNGISDYELRLGPAQGSWAMF